MALFYLNIFADLGNIFVPQYFSFTDILQHGGAGSVKVML